MNNIKLGIIGTNFISDWLAAAVLAADGIVMHAVYSRTAEKGAEFAAKYDIKNVFTDLEAFLSSDVDAVYVASPNFLHFEQSLKAIEHGKHVLVEKPACLCQDDFIRLVEAAKKNSVVVMEAMRPAHDPAILEAVRVAKSGEIGKVRAANIEYCQYSSRYDKFRAGEILNAFNPALGNAAIMDIGVYALHAAVMFFGKPSAVFSKSVLLHNGMEGHGSVLMDCGIPVNVSYSKITESLNPSVITGEDGYITLKRLSSVDEVAVTNRKSGEKSVIACAEQRSHGNMLYEVRDFVDIVGGKMSVDKFNSDTLITLGIMDEIRRQNGIVFPLK